MLNRGFAIIDASEEDDAMDEEFEEINEGALELEDDAFVSAISDSQ
jgi:hypothetical protein